MLKKLLLLFVLMLLLFHAPYLPWLLGVMGWHVGLLFGLWALYILALFFWQYKEAKK